MLTELHSFHIPVMGIGHSVDTPIRVAPLGISSVISLVDDLLLEQLRHYYSRANNLPWTAIPREVKDGRAKRITAYLDLVLHLVNQKMEAMRREPFFGNNDKDTYFRLLPEESTLKADYQRLKTLSPGPERESLARDLASKMRPGSIDVNIMVKLDRENRDPQGKPLGSEFSDAQAALRGFAESRLDSCVVLSAGMSKKLFASISQFRDFYRDSKGELKKKIVLKVSDFRSAFVQAKLLAKRGLEVSEFRVESGLNCGGHAFPTRGKLLPWILTEFREKWGQLKVSAASLVGDYYGKMGWSYPAIALPEPLLTVQGGIGTSGEARRLREGFGVDRTGWGSPFLLVPEATNVDDVTRELLRQAKAGDLYLSDISPLGIPFNTVRGTGSEIWTHEQWRRGAPGSPCGKGFAVTSTEFSETPLCLASREYQGLKLAEIEGRDIPTGEKELLKAAVVKKTCICTHLGNGVLIKLGLKSQIAAPPAVCPGPNLAWFDRLYTLKEMVDHIYGRGPSLVPRERPHMFAQELVINMDYFEELLSGDGSADSNVLLEYKENLEQGIALCLDIARTPPYADENLASLARCAKEQQLRLNSLYSKSLAA